MWQAARLYRRGLAPRIIVSGGSFLAKHGGPPTSEADAMRIFLLDLGVPSEAIVDEPEALNTMENIRNVRAMVGDGLVVAGDIRLSYAACAADRRPGAPGSMSAHSRRTTRPRRRSALPWDNWMPSVDGLALVDPGDQGDSLP